MDYEYILEELETKLNISKVKSYPASGQKSVFLVQCKKTKQKQILKIIFQNNVNRVMREIEIQKRYNFEYTPRIIDYDNYKDRALYILEEYIPGDDLRAIIINDSRYNACHVIEFGEKILDILQEFEEKRLVHRDLKPENIILSEKDWYVIDFGIAKAREFNSLTMIDTGNIGPHTPGYGAPELFMYDSNLINIRADIFSLGILMYEIATGYNPFISNPASDPNAQILYGETELAQIKEDSENMDLAKLIKIFMSVDISKRPRNVATAKRWLRKVKKKL